MWMKNMNNFQAAKVQLQGVAKHFPAGIYLLKVNNRNTRTRCEICSKLTLNVFDKLDFFANFSLALVIEVLLIKKAYIFKVNSKDTKTSVLLLYC